MARRGGRSGEGRKTADAQLARLSEIKADPAAPGADEELSGALGGKNHLVAARAAEIVADAKLAVLEPALVESFRFFLDNTDRGCMAKTAIARALLVVESRQEEILLLGARHVQPEPGFG